MSPLTAALVCRRPLRPPPSENHHRPRDSDRPRTHGRNPEPMSQMTTKGEGIARARNLLLDNQSRLISACPSSSIAPASSGLHDRHPHWPRRGVVRMAVM